MTMHTTLSGSVAQALLPVRFCYGNPKKPPHLALSLTIEFLIANLELEFRLTHRKLSPLKISNRKYSAIFCLAFHAHSPLTCSKEVSAPHISNRNIHQFKNRLKPLQTKQKAKF